MVLFSLIIFREKSFLFEIRANFPIEIPVSRKIISKKQDTMGERIAKQITNLVYKKIKK